MLREFKFTGNEYVDLEDIPSPLFKPPSSPPSPLPNGCNKIPFMPSDTREGGESLP